MKLIIVAAVMLASAAQAQVYKCPGPDGKTLYSDAPCAAGQKMDDAKLRGSSLGPAIASPQQPARTDSPAGPQAATPEKAAGVCPSPQEIRNLETSASSRTMAQREKDFMQAEVRRARACAREGGTYTAADWKRIFEAHSAQSSPDPATRAAGRAAAEAIHGSAASANEQQRMGADRKLQAQREMTEEMKKGVRRCTVNGRVVDC